MNSLTNTAPVLHDIHDIRAPYVITTGHAWVGWLVALTVLAAVAAFCLWRWLKRKPAVKAGPPPMPPHVRAKLRLAEALTMLHDPKPFCVLVSDTVRYYLEERFQFRAPERTTEEFLRELKKTDLLLADQKESLGGFLAGCDLVKFAKYEPGEKELRELHGSALRLVEETAPVAPTAAPGVPPVGPAPTSTN